jgi:hypothetical protein
METEDWASLAALIAMFAMVAICTASVAYWANSAYGLLSMLCLFGIRVRIGKTAREIALCEARRR